MIKITSKFTNIESTPAISEYIDKKVTMLEKFIDENDTSALADVEVGKTTNRHAGGEVFRAEINFHVGTKHLRAESTTSDLYASIDEAKDEIARELDVSKKKETTLFRKGGKKIKDILKGFTRR